MSALFVTSLYDLQTFENNTKRRAVSAYYNSSYFLRSIPYPMVIFTEPRMISDIQSLFASNEHVTIIGCPWEQLKYFDYIDKLKIFQTIHPYQTTTPDKYTPAHMVIMWNKFNFIEKSHELFPNYDRYIWIDFGIEHATYIYNSQTDWKKIISSMSPDKFCCTLLNPITTEEYENVILGCSRWQYRQVGGFWSVGNSIFDFYIRRIYQEIQTVLDNQCLCADEDIMARFSYTNPEKCQFSFGNYASCIVNWMGLRYDIGLAKKVINDMHRQGRHHAAVMGIEKILEGFANGWMEWSEQDVFNYLIIYYIETYYLNTEKARMIATHIADLSHRNHFIHDRLNGNNYFRDIFKFIFTEYEMTHWLPENVANVDRLSLPYWVDTVKTRLATIPDLK